MPGIDYGRLRDEISMEEVLGLLGYEPTLRRGEQWYGHCPFDDDQSVKRRTVFAIHVGRHCYYCHKCHRRGDHLDLWSAFTKLPLHRASIELCKQLGRPIPWIDRW